MKETSQVTVFLVAVLLSVSSSGDFDYRRAIEGIADDIAGLKDSHPQLKDFSVTQHLKADKHQISYGRGGWTSGVPNPDEDGIWFYIDFHNPGSTLQNHTQPAAIPYCVGAMRLSFLSLEGRKTKSVEGAIWNILKKHGATRCQ